MTAVKTADKTDNNRGGNPGPEREGRKKTRGKVSGAGPAFFPLISCNSSNHSDRRRAIDGESKQRKGDIRANARNGGGQMHER